MRDRPLAMARHAFPVLYTQILDRLTLHNLMRNNKAWDRTSRFNQPVTSEYMAMKN